MNDKDLEKEAKEALKVCREIWDNGIHREWKEMEKAIKDYSEKMTSEKPEKEK